jgi:hypothetical protein
MGALELSRRSKQSPKLRYAGSWFSWFNLLEPNFRCMQAEQGGFLLGSRSEDCRGKLRLLRLGAMRYASGMIRRLPDNYIEPCVRTPVVDNSTG